MVQNYNQGNNYNQNQGYIQNQGQNSNIPHITYPSTDEMLRNFMISTEVKFNSLATSVSRMEKSLQERPQGVLPSNIVPNPREYLKAITTRSGVTFAGLISERIIKSKRAKTSKTDKKRKRQVQERDLKPISKPDQPDTREKSR
ncbi:hypothetical protein Tco_1581136, partial [Tanacetum coccineum]